MKTVLLNLRELLKNKPLFLGLLVLVQAISAFCLMFIIGVIINNKLFIGRSTYYDACYVYLSDESELTYGEVEDTVFYIYDEILEGAGANLIIQTSSYEKQMITTQVIPENGKYKAATDMRDLIPMQLVRGRGFTDEDMNSDIPMAILANVDTDELTLYDRKAEIIGSCGFHPLFTEKELYVNPAALKDAKLVNLYIRFDRYITEEENDQMIEALDKVMAGHYEWYNEAMPEDEGDYKAVLKGVILSCAMIGIVLVGTLGIIMNHILQDRRYKLSVFRLTGCSVIHTAKLLIVEMMAITIPSLVLGLGAFYLAQVNKLQQIYPYMKVYLNEKTYLLLFAGLTMLILLFSTIVVLINVCKPINKQLAVSRK